MNKNRQMTKVNHNNEKCINLEKGSRSSLTSDKNKKEIYQHENNEPF